MRVCVCVCMCVCVYVCMGVNERDGNGCDICGGYGGRDGAHGCLQFDYAGACVVCISIVSVCVCVYVRMCVCVYVRMCVCVCVYGCK